MSAYLFPTRLDRLVKILSQLDDEEWRSLKMCGSGGGNLRVRELRQVGLVMSRNGRDGGHKLALPWSDIRLAYLLATGSDQTGMTMRLFHFYGHVTIKDLLAWPEAMRGKYRSSLEAVTDVASRLSTTRPTMPSTLSDLPYCKGYIEQIVAGLAQYGLVKSIYRQGRILTQPYATLTVGDIAPVLAHRGHIHSAIILKSANIKLVDI